MVHVSPLPLFLALNGYFFNLASVEGAANTWILVQDQGAPAGTCSNYSITGIGNMSATDTQCQAIPSTFRVNDYVTASAGCFQVALALVPAADQDKCMWTNGQPSACISPPPPPPCNRIYQFNFGTGAPSLNATNQTMPFWNNMNDSNIIDYGICFKMQLEPNSNDVSKNGNVRRMVVEQHRSLCIYPKRTVQPAPCFVNGTCCSGTILGTISTQYNGVDCQNRCKTTLGCACWNFNVNSAASNCQLYSNTAMSACVGYVSGPPSCCKAPSSG